VRLPEDLLLHLDEQFILVTGVDHFLQCVDGLPEAVECLSSGAELEPTLSLRIRILAATDLEILPNRINLELCCFSIDGL
jgi:hypothetical protein